MTPHLYVMANVGRTSLGKMLLPWARAEIFRHQRHVPMLAPRWNAPGLGSWFDARRGRRSCFGMFDPHGYVGGLSRLAVLMTARKISEADFVHGAEDQHGSRRKTLVVFSGAHGLFAPLLPHRELIRRRLTEMLSIRMRGKLARQNANFVIGVHVRRGGKRALNDHGAQLDPRGSMPIAWFIKSIQNLRRTLGFAAPVRLFSDAPPDELAALLAMPNVSLAAGNPSIIDLLTLARSRILVTTAHSMFSRWASFLGEMPTLWYPGGSAKLFPDKPAYESETDLEGHISPEFIGVVESLNLALNP